jgi:quinol monooxygenase YgiN
MKEIAVIAEFNFIPAQINNALTILQNIIMASRKELGCLFYQLYQSDNDQNVYTMIERWKSHEDWQCHMQSTHIVHAAQAIQTCLQKAIVVSSYTFKL